MRDQIRRASVSIMANIAEGFGRKTNEEFVSFLRYSLASAAELQSHLYVALDLRYIDETIFNDLYEQAATISRLITAFIQYLSAHTRPEL